MGYIGNQDYTIIRNTIGDVQGTSTEADILTKPPVEGDLWVAADTGDKWMSDGTTWINLGPLRGEQGKGISSILRTAGDGTGIDTYTITYTDSLTTTFNVTNGTGGTITSVNGGSSTAMGMQVQLRSDIEPNWVADNPVLLAGEPGIDITNGTLKIGDGVTDWNTLPAISGGNGTAGVGITSIVKTGTAGLVDTYTITYSDASTSTFAVSNGAPGVAGASVDHITKTAGTGLAGTTDTYTLWQDVAETVSLGTFSVYNGANGAGAGDMLMTVYDTTGNGKVDVAEVAESVDWANIANKPIDLLVDSDVGVTVQGYNANTTVQGNTFNGADQLVKLDGTGKLPAIDGSLLTGVSTVGSINDLTDVDTITLAPTTGNVLKWDGTNWVPGVSSGGTVINTPVITAPADGTTNFSGTVTTDTYSTVAPFNGPQDYVEWEAGNVDFTTLYDSYSGASNFSSWVPSISSPLLQVYVRIRKGSGSYLSDWSTAVSFTTPNIYIGSVTLTVEGSPSYVDLTPLLTGSTFTVVNGTGTHVSTDWQILSGASVVWESLDDTVNKTSIQVNTSLTSNTSYAFRVRYKGTTYGYSAWTEHTYSTANVTVQTPTITVTGTPSDVSETPTITGSAFTVVNGSDTHVSTDWQVVKVSDSSVVWQSLGNTTNLVTVSVPAGVLLTSTEYSFKARYNGATYTSAYGSTNGTTKATFSQPAGTAGALGFSVGPSTGNYAALGLSEMTGTTTVGHDNYGNYQHTNGSIVCFMPRMWYRVGHPDSPRYATYGKNAIDMVPASTYATEALANAAGYVLPRVFIDGGAIQEGVFVDKYMASKSTTNSNIAVSVKNGNPIGLTTNASYNPSSTMTGCTGTLADAVVLARARGTGWQSTSAFVRGWVAMTSLAQAQAATNTTDVAWYDPALVTNFPKGCNNGSRADVNDTSVTWSASPDTPAKGLTGSASNFAKSTHNGANNGIADVNGLMYEVDIGMTYPGTSATDATPTASNITYILKQSVAIADLTAGWDGANDVWGNTTHIQALYDQVTAPLPIGSNIGAVYWGNGTNQAISDAVSGVGRDLAGFLAKDTNAIDAVGTSQFGNDYLYKYNRANQFVHSCGNWVGASGAGVFFRVLNDGRSNGNAGDGFRSCAYVSL